MPPELIRNSAEVRDVRRQLPLDIIHFHPETHVEVRYPDECWHCGSCRQDCPANAITIVFPRSWPMCKPIHRLCTQPEFLRRKT